MENLDRIDDSKRIASWLATTARREAIRILRTKQRETPEDGKLIEEAMDLTGPDPECHSDTIDPEMIAMSQQDSQDFWAAFSSLSSKEKQLLRVVAVTPMNSYAEVAQILGMTAGSIGPTRSRALERLKQALAAQRREREAL